MLKIYDGLTQCPHGEDSNPLAGLSDDLNGNSSDDPLRLASDSVSNEDPESIAPIISDAPDVSSNLESPKHLFIRENSW